MQEILYKNFGDDMEKYKNAARAELRLKDLIARAIGVEQTEYALSLIRDAEALGQSPEVELGIQWLEDHVVVDLYLPYRTYTADEAELMHKLFFFADSFILCDGGDYVCGTAMQLICGLR